MGRSVKRAGVYVVLLTIAASTLVLVTPAPVAAVSPDVVVSQVYGGGGNTGATHTHDFIELYNRGASPVSLAGWSVQYTSATGTGNFGSSSTLITELAGTIGPGQYLLVQEASQAAVGVPLPTPAIVDPTPISMAGTAGKVALVTDSSSLGCNGGSTPCGASQLARIRDLVGYGNANFFEGAAAPTLSNTTAAIRAGGGATDTDNNNADFSAATPNPRNTVPPVTDPPPADLVVSQVYGGGGNSGATLTNDYIELFNQSAAPVSLAGWSVQYATATGSSWAVTPLTGTIAAGRYYLVQEAAGGGGTTPLPTPDATGSINLAASAGKVALVRSATPLACATGCSAVTLVQDLVGYGTADDFEGTGPAPAPSNTEAAVRNGDGATDTDNNAADFSVAAATPRNSAFVPPPPVGSGCETPATRQIAEVQGSGTSSPLVNTVVRIEGIVTGDFQGPAQLGGFFVQDDTPDADPLTSDGIFVFSSLAAAVGDRVLVNGRAIEFSGLTELSPVTAVDVCGTGSIAPAPYDLPRPVGTTFEPAEGVLLIFPEVLTATEHFQLGRFGEVTVSADGRLFQPTDRVDPGAPAQAALELAGRRRLLIDDGSGAQNPPTVPFVSPGNALRIGDTTAGVTGVLSFGFNLYRLQPTAPITFQRTNPRPAGPADVGGDVSVASFNTLNFFTTLADDNPDARGADDANEYQRQLAKEVAAITGLDADVLGLMEVENNGATAIGALVDALNAATAPGTYAFVTEPVVNAPNEFGGTFGTDFIKTALIYKPAVVAPVGPAQTSTDAIFDRPPLVQTFAPLGGGESFTLAVNHFKSKNCGPGAPGDADLGDGQSCFNARRVLQAQALDALLDQLNPPNPLIIGDLNAYTEEDPIHTLEAAGYTGLSERFVADADRYSFVFDGFSGELDHALASPALLDNVTGTTIWHINADEPLILDYNTEFNPPGLYEPNAFRTSDHDPLLVGLELTTVPAAPAVSALAGWNAATVSWTPPLSEGGSPVTGYQVRVLRGATVVDTVSVGPAVRERTFGSLANGVTYTFEVVAVNAEGPGPAGSATATPFVPVRPARVSPGVACPNFVARNPNPFPVSISWTSLLGLPGRGAVPAASTVTLTSVRRLGVLTLYAGQGTFQGIAIGIC